MEKYLMVKHLYPSFFENKKVGRILFCIILFVITVIVFLFNHFTPLLADDYGYMFSRVTHQPISGFSDIYLSEVNHYFTWGGRIVTHSIAQTFLWWGKPIFNVINTLGYILFLLLIYTHAIGSFKCRPFLLLIVSTGVFIFTPAWGQSMVWLVGASNYLWGPLLILFFLLPFRIQFEQSNDVINNKTCAFAYGCFGIIAGATNENSTVALIIMICFCLFLIWEKHKKIPFYMWIGLAGAFIGACLLIFAPGNFVRVAAEHDSVNVFSNFTYIIKLFVKPSFLFFPCTVLAALLILRGSRCDKVWLVYFIGSVASMFAMVASPYYPDRAQSITIALMIIAIGNVYCHLTFTTEKAIKLLILSTITLVLGNIWVYNYAFKDIRSYYKGYNEQFEHLSALKKEGQTVAHISNIHPKTQYTGASGNEYWCDRILLEYLKLKDPNLKP